MKQGHLYLSEAGVSLQHTPQARQSVNFIPSLRRSVCQLLGDILDKVAILSSCSLFTALPSTPRFQG